MPGGHAECGSRVGGVGRDRCGGRHGEALPEVAGRTDQVHPERGVVGCLQARDRIRLARRVRVEPFDHRVVERVAAGGSLGVRLPLQRPDDVLGLDLHVPQRRRVMKSWLEMERPGQAVARHRGHGGGQVRMQDCPSLRRRGSVIGHERPEQAAPEQLPRIGEVGLLRIEPAPLQKRRRREIRRNDPQSPSPWHRSRRMAGTPLRLRGSPGAGSRQER